MTNIYLSPIRIHILDYTVATSTTSFRRALWLLWGDASFEVFESNTISHQLKLRICAVSSYLRGLVESIVPSVGILAWDCTFGKILLIPFEFCGVIIQ